MTSPPVVVGRYRLDALVRPDVDPSTWRGTDLSTSRTVRVCLVGSETGSAARSRRSAAHPGLVPVIDVVRVRDGVTPAPSTLDARGDTFVVLDPVVGETLEDLVARKGAIDSVRAVRLILALANGLAAVHAGGSVHGGVLPLAIEVRTLEDGGPRLALAGLYDGAIAYASPSRLCDGGPSTHDDAWGLLACLYFAVTGAAPFAAESPQALARRVLGGRPVPIRGVTATEQDLQKMFDRGFSRTAGHRYPDVSTLRDDLRAWLAKHGQASDAPLVTIAPPPVATTVTAKRRLETPPDAYPRIFPTTTSVRNKTAPWGGDEERNRRSTPTETPATARESGRLPIAPDVAPPAAGGAPLSTAESGPAVAESARPPANDSARPRATSSRPPPSRPPSSRPPASAPPANDETARFSRDQLAMLEREAARAAAADEPVGPRIDAMAATMMAASATTERKLPAAASAVTARKIAIEAAAPGEVVDRSAPPPPAKAAPAPHPRRRLEIGLMIAAVAVGTSIIAFILTRPAASSDAAPVTTRSASAATAAPPPPIAHSAPRAAPSAMATATVSAAAPPSASASASAAADADELLACVARSFPPDTFDPDAELSFVCKERDGRRGAQRLRRAIVAGGRGARISEAMREWSRYRWYELPVYATVRARCCPGAPPVEPPAISTTCAAPRETLNAVAAAAASGTDLEPALRQYRRLVSCLMESGDFPAFGQEGPIGGGEEASYRAVVARGKR